MHQLILKEEMTIIKKENEDDFMFFFNKEDAPVLYRWVSIYTIEDLVKFNL